MPFTIEQHYLDEMVKHAKEDDPNECCGVLLGQGGRVVNLRRCTNAEHSPYRYSVEPRELLAIDRETRENNWDLLAIYHSHTHTPAYPSPTDVRLAGYPEALYILVSLQDPARADVHAYHIVDGVITEEAIERVTDRAAAEG